ncbi:MAG: dihydrofolate reductase family protein [Parafilimonas sp.]
MRKIIVSNLISVDGYFEGMNQDLSWFTVNEEFFEYARNLLHEVDTIMYGRVTYEHMADYWPNAKDNDEVITQKMNSLQKIIFSKTLEEAIWNNSLIIKESIVEEVKKLKQQPGKDIVIFGSGTIVSELTQWRLIDEYRLIVNPVILGNGNPLFKSINERIKLKLIKTKTLASGVIILYYQPEKIN